MRPVIKHAWQLSIPEAKEIQLKLVEQLTLKPLKDLPTTIAATDVSYTRWDRMGYAVVGIYDIIYDNNHHPVELKEQLIETYVGTVDFPYVPGYLSFREIPMLLPIFEMIDTNLDLIIADGVGIAHPRGLGLAAHLGLLFDIPSIGCAKSKLVGEYQEPGRQKGDHSKLEYKGQQVGTVLRSKDSCNPLFISPGFACSIDDARKVIAGLCFTYRVCEPIRRVDHISKELRKQHKQE